MAPFPALAAPSDAAMQLSVLEGSDLVSYFRNLSWSATVLPHLESVSEADLRKLAQRVSYGLKESGLKANGAVLSDEDSKELREFLLFVYGQTTPGERGASEIVADLNRAWDSKNDADEGVQRVGASLDPIFFKEKPHSKSHKIRKYVDSLGIGFDDARGAAFSNVARKFGVKISAKTSVKSLLRYWECCTAPSTVRGFVGRFEGESESDVVELFRKHWNQNLIEELDADEAGELARFVLDSDAAASPRASHCRRRLIAVIRGSTEQDTALRLRLSTDPVGEKDGAGNNGAKQVTHADAQKKKGTDFKIEIAPRDGGLRHNRAMRADEGKESGIPFGEQRMGKKSSKREKKTEPLSVIGYDSSSTSDSDSSPNSETSSSGDEVDFRTGEIKCPWTHLPRTLKRAYEQTSRKMRQILDHGGPRLLTMFEPHRSSITSPKQLNMLHDLCAEEQKVTDEVCHARGLSVKARKCQNAFTDLQLYQVRPKQRRTNLAFPAPECIAPFEIKRWLTNGSLEEHVKNLAARIGSVDKETSDGYLAREVLVIGLALASMLDEFHPAGVSHTIVAERLVRRLLIIEKGLQKDRGQRATYDIGNMAFLWIGGGEKSQTRRQLGL